jgi:hypothetical protein
MSMKAWRDLIPNEQGMIAQVIIKLLNRRCTVAYIVRLLNTYALLWRLLQEMSIENQAFVIEYARNLYRDEVQRWWQFAQLDR